MGSKSTKIYASLLILLMVPLCFALFANHLVRGHDALAGLIRALYMDQYIGDGQFLVRWASNINFGYGSPMFDFYPPFFYLVTAMFSKIFHNVLMSLNLVCVIFWFLSGLGMYLFARELWGNKGGFLSALAYVYAPYYIQDFYVRGAFAEQSTFALFPFLLLALYKLNQNIQRRYILMGVISTTALSLAHTIGMFFLPIATVYLTFLFILNKNWKAFLYGTAILFIGWLMAAFFWLPALIETKYLTLSFMTSMRYDFHKNFISLTQLLRPPWDMTTDLDRLTFQIGLGHVFLALLPVVFLLRNYTKEYQKFFHYIFFGIVAAFAFWLTLPSSQKIWEAIAVLKFLQFPWRFLTIGVFALSLLTGGAVLLFRKELAKSLFVAGAVGLIIFMSFRFFYPGDFFNVDQQDLRNNLLSKVFLGEGERTPRWIQYPPLVAPAQKFEIVQGIADISEYKAINAIKHTAKIFTDQPVVVCFHSFYFPGWRVFMDGKEASINPNNKYGIILFEVPPGEHRVTVVFGSTPIRTMATVISWVGAALFVFLMINFRRNKF